MKKLFNNALMTGIIAFYSIALVVLVNTFPKFINELNEDKIIDSADDTEETIVEA